MKAFCRKIKGLVATVCATVLFSAVFAIVISILPKDCHNSDFSLTRYYCRLAYQAAVGTGKVAAKAALGFLKELLCCLGAVARYKAGIR